MQLEAHIRAHVEPNFQLADLPFSVREVHFEKDTIVTDYGAVEDQVYFIESGIVEVGLLRQGEPRILDFFFPGEFFCSYASMLQRRPSDVQLSALTPLRCQAIHAQELLAAYAHSLFANRLGRIETERLYLKKVKREKDLLTKTAAERYQDLLDEHPQWIQQMPVQKIALYLGIHPGSLSRIRRTVFPHMC